MDYKTAKSIIYNHYLDSVGRLGTSDVSAKRIIELEEICLDLLDKQLPKKPVKINHVYICANDGVFLLYDDEIPIESDSYCSRCGQKIDWSDVNGDKV